MLCTDPRNVVGGCIRQQGQEPMHIKYMAKMIVVVKVHLEGVVNLTRRA